jgi:hypothetical protein
LSSYLLLYHHSSVFITLYNRSYFVHSLLIATLWRLPKLEWSSSQNRTWLTIGQWFEFSPCGMESPLVWCVGVHHQWICARSSPFCLRHPQWLYHHSRWLHFRGWLSYSGHPFWVETQCSFITILFLSSSTVVVTLDLPSWLPYCGRCQSQSWYVNRLDKKILDLCCVVTASSHHP